MNASLGSAPDATAAVGIRKHDAVIVQTFTLQKAVTEANLDAAETEIESLFGPLVRDRTPQQIEVDQLPALVYDRVAAPGVPNAESRIVFIFDADHEYFLNCQATPAMEQEVQRACGLAMDTFELK